MLVVLAMTTSEGSSKMLFANQLMADLRFFDDFDPMQDIELVEAEEQFEKYTAVVNYLEKAKEPKWLLAMNKVCDKILEEEGPHVDLVGDSKLLLSSEKSKVVT